MLRRSAPPPARTELGYLEIRSPLRARHRGWPFGERGAKLVAVLIGERPGLSSPDSLGAYLTYAPRISRTNAERNCVPIIRPERLGYETAARRIDWIAAVGVARGVTGVELKDEIGALPGARTIAKCEERSSDAC